MSFSLTIPSDQATSLRSYTEEAGREWSPFFLRSLSFDTAYNSLQSSYLYRKATTNKSPVSGINPFMSRLCGRLAFRSQCISRSTLIQGRHSQQAASQSFLPRPKEASWVWGSGISPVQVQICGLSRLYLLWCVTKWLLIAR